jgi:hypothetical protein
MFEGFNDKCRFQRSYVVWSGNNLLKRIRLKSDLIEHYFPKHAEYLKKKEIGAEEILKENQ